jgi:hypothetical protein
LSRGARCALRELFLLLRPAIESSQEGPPIEVLFITQILLFLIFAHVKIKKIANEDAEK